MRQVPAGLLKFPLMNIIIENADSLEYLTANGEWTKTAPNAKRFGTTGTAFAAAKLETVGKFNIVGYVTETRQFINLDHGRGKSVAA
jgi:hypothetical protein